MNALISVWDKSKLDKLGSFLLNRGFNLVSTGGTYRYLEDRFPEASSRLIKVSDLTEFPEILGGRVKTLHPEIYGGILSKKNNPEHTSEIQQHGCLPIEVIVVNLYPFHQAVEGDYDLVEAQELIDIGGVSLIRAGAKNFQEVAVLTSPSQYDQFMESWGDSGEFRRRLAMKAFEVTSQYDRSIADYLVKRRREPEEKNQMEIGAKSREIEITNSEIRQYTQRLPLKYGCNPHQRQAMVWSIDDASRGLSSGLPFRLLGNGSAGYINIMDALNSWMLVREGRELFDMPCVASFKHTSPAGVGLAVELSTQLRISYGVGTDEVLTPLATAYVRARNSDPMSSFGDFVALSEPCDLATAKLIKREVSDGVIAPGFAPEALEILQKKKGGRYLILEVDPNYGDWKETGGNPVELRELHGVALTQEMNLAQVGFDVFENEENYMTNKMGLTAEAKRDLLLANLTLKYAQSNNVAFAKDGQVVAIASGQQSRVDCVKLACRKLQTWFMRQHFKVWQLMDLFRTDIKITRSQKVNAIIRYVEGDMTSQEIAVWEKLFVKYPEPLRDAEKIEFMRSLTGVCLASDAFFPFRDNIDHASKYGVQYVIQPGGSNADDCVVEACNQYGMVMVRSGVRVFTH